MKKMLKTMRTCPNPLPPQSFLMIEQPKKPLNKKSKKNFSSPTNVNNTPEINKKKRKPPFRLDNNTDSLLRFATLNVRGLNDTDKQDTLMDMIQDLKLDVLGISETNLKASASKHFSNRLSNHVFYSTAANDDKLLGIGTGLIISKELNRHVQRFETYTNRACFVDLFFRGNNRMRLIQVYLHASHIPQNRTEITQLHNTIDHWIDEGNKGQFKILVMGDFNLNTENYYRDNLTTAKWKYQIMNTLHQNNFRDSISFFQDDFDDIQTFINSQGPDIRIDYIWINEDLLINSINSTVLDVIHINTDHRMVTLSLFKEDFFRQASLNKIRQRNRIMKKNTRQIFLYQDMEPDDWEEYTNETRKIWGNDHLMIQNFGSHQDSEDFKQERLNQEWNRLQNSILNAANAKIKSKPVPCRPTNRSTDLQASLLHNDLKFITRVYMRISKWIKNDNLHQIYEFWNEFKILSHKTSDKTYRKVKLVLERHKIDDSLPRLMTSRVEVVTLLADLLEVKSILQTKYKLAARSFKDKKIKDYIQQRCDDYQDNKRRMINSLTEKNLKKISIETVYKKDNEVEVLITDPDIVMKETNQHFQTIAGAVNKEKILVEGDHWYKQYDPKTMNINADIYKDLMQIPSWEDWLLVIKELPSGKAAGKSGISYEMIKHLSEEMQISVYNLVCSSISTGRIPDAWNEATVYPIPKLKPFNANLSNTRPITLLETVQKITVSIINKRLSTILRDNNVLKGNQFAGLPLSSTFEPIRVIKGIIQDAEEYNKELWLLSQDLGKAYDRVNIYMLERALRRINLPPLFISFIKHLFLHRTNQVFTSYGLTDKYEVKIGIDQGEIISPLLWCIYYDPLLTEVEQSKLGYTIQQRYKRNIFDRIFQSKSFSTASVAFMDDTQWLSNSQSNLEKILTIADSFYKLNDIQVNKDKSELLVRTVKKKHRKKKYRKFNSLKDFEFMDNVIVTDEPPLDYNAEISLKFGEKLANDGTICPDSILIKPKLPNESIRILGTYFNIENHSKYIEFLIRNEVINTVNVMKKKKITDKHILYIFNHVLAPRVEFWSQVSIISEKILNYAMSPLRRLFKNNSHLALSAPNAVMDNSFIYNFRNLCELQIQSKITNFLVQLNSQGLLQRLTIIQLLQIQQQEYLSKNILAEFPFDKVPRHYAKNFIFGMLNLCKNNNILFETSLLTEFDVTGGDVTLRSILKEDYRKYKDHLSRDHIMFLNQITSISGNKLLEWREIDKKTFRTYHATTSPLWYLKVKSITTLNDSYFLKPEYIRYEHWRSEERR